MKGTKIGSAPRKAADDGSLHPRLIHRGDQILNPCYFCFRIFIDRRKSFISFTEGFSILSYLIRKDMGMAVDDHGLWREYGPFSLLFEKAHIPFPFSNDFGKLIGEVNDAGMFGDDHSSIDDKI